jgi:hypothetical protein
MRRILVVAVMLVLPACGDDAGVIAPEDTVPSADVAIDSMPSQDIGALDTSPPEDAGSEEDVASSCEPGEGCFNEPCSGPDGCNSGICTMHLGEKVCSKTCDSECPAGWTCSLVGGGGDGQYVCLSNASHLCLPCTSSDGCTSETPQACVRYPGGTSFCGSVCSVETPCPEGYSCQSVETVAGTMSNQCMPDSGMCGCTSLAVESGLATSCVVENEVGTCDGKRACTENGLDACDASTPSVETCDGIDNDCNGLVDENTCDDGNACTEDTCAGAEGCTYAALDMGECLDGDACTQADHCEAGACVGEALECGDANPCTDDACDPGSGCVYLPNNLTCIDGEACTIGDTCKAGSCVPGVSITCDDGNPCTDDICGEAGCVFTPNALECDDQNACTAESVCQAGACVGTSSLNCDDNNSCTTETCDPVQGCVSAPNDTPCDDVNACTIGDACGEGACVAGATSLNCDDGNPCTDDACSDVLGCVFTPNAGDCDDKNACTTGDACVEGACVGIGSLACDDGNPCTVDSCLLGDGCAYVPVEGACDDGDACTVNDACNDSVCMSGVVLSCDDGNPCTDSSCVVGDCVFEANEVACDDGNACSTGDICSSGNCKADGALTCDDGNICTSDACDPLLGCTHVANALPCSDGDACTVGDTCLDGGCGAGPSALACDDGNVCTDDSCDAEAGCMNTNNATLCDDGNACSTGDACTDGACKPQGVLVCADDNPCTDDGCHLVDGCTFDSNTVPCDDGDPCSVGDICADGGCQSGDGSLACDDSNPCTVDQCTHGVGCENTPELGQAANCCLSADDCGPAFSSASSCNDISSCQGSRNDAICVTYQCASSEADDDSGCDGFESKACGEFPSVYCSGESDQEPPLCDTTCNSDDECDPSAHCDEGECKPDVGPGGDCDEASDCESGICISGTCCNSECSVLGCGLGQCGGDGVCLEYTDGEQHGCSTCQTCDGSGQCSGVSVEGAQATALGCNEGAEACRRCAGGGCGFHTSGQHGCSNGQVCNGSGQCEDDVGDEVTVCFDPYPGNMGITVGSQCPNGYSHKYHVCGGNINSYSWGPYFDDKVLLHNGPGDHCWCCCDCNSVCVVCTK